MQTQLFMNEDNYPKPSGYQETSREAYREIKRNPLDLGEKQRIVFDCIKFLSGKFGPCTDKEVADWLYWDINRVTGRRNELVAMGKVEEAGKKSQNGRTAITWRVSE